MLGVLCPGQGRVKAERGDILGLPVLWVSVSTGGILEKRRLVRAERLLLRHGVRRLLPLREAPKWQNSLPAVDPLPLYRTLADRLTLEVLKRNGIEPHRAAVTLTGEQVDGDLARTAHLLCPRVHTLRLEVGRGGERLTMELYREFGAAVCAGGQADLCIRFSGEPRPGELVLCGVPELLGLGLKVHGLELPQELEPVPLLTALWQAGLLNVEELRMVRQ